MSVMREEPQSWQRSCCPSDGRDNHAPDCAKAPIVQPRHTPTLAAAFEAASTLALHYGPQYIYGALGAAYTPDGEEYLILNHDDPKRRELRGDFQILYRLERPDDVTDLTDDDLQTRLIAALNGKSNETLFSVLEADARKRWGDLQPGVEQPTHTEITQALEADHV